jgi:phage-related protein
VVQAFPSSHAAVMFVWRQPVARSQVSVVHGLLSSQFGPGPLMQDPLPHVSPTVHAFPSSQAAVLFVWTHPVAGLHMSVVHTLPSLQTTPVPPHTPVVQTSAWVQALPSLQVVPFVFAGFEQTPEAGLHTPAAWHWSEAVQTTGAPLPQTPVAGLHTPAAWHKSEPEQTTGAPVQEPPWQASVWVQASPSSQGVPFATRGSEQSTRVLTVTPSGLARADVGPGPIRRMGAASPLAALAYVPTEREQGLVPAWEFVTTMASSTRSRTRPIGLHSAVLGPAI